jgi:hypothetical protein
LWNVLFHYVAWQIVAGSKGLIAAEAEKMQPPSPPDGLQAGQKRPLGAVWVRRATNPAEDIGTALTRPVAAYSSRRWEE